MPYLRTFTAHNLCFMPHDSSKEVRKMKKLLSVFICLLLAGCTVPPTEKSRIVTQIRIEANSPDLCRAYTDPQKMETILYYLRSLKRGRAASTNPERFAGTNFHIELHYSDGSNRHVFQRADRFLSEEFQPWQEVSYGAFLTPILQNMPND